MATRKQTSPEKKSLKTRGAASRSRSTSDRILRTHPRATAIAVSAALAPWIWQQPALADPATTQLPTGGQVVSGTATISTNGSKMDVNQSTNSTIINWQN